jgi:hypothetical protein
MPTSVMEQSPTGICKRIYNSSHGISRPAFLHNFNTAKTHQWNAFARSLVWITVGVVNMINISLFSSDTPSEFLHGSWTEPVRFDASFMVILTTHSTPYSHSNSMRQRPSYETDRTIPQGLPRPLYKIHCCVPKDPILSKTSPGHTFPSRVFHTYFSLHSL